MTRQNSTSWSARRTVAKWATWADAAKGRPGSGWRGWGSGAAGGRRAGWWWLFRSSSRAGGSPRGPRTPRSWPDSETAWTKVRSRTSSSIDLKKLKEKIQKSVITVWIVKHEWKNQLKISQLSKLRNTMMSLFLLWPPKEIKVVLKIPGTTFCQVH